jgi:hypothetical protein
MPGWLIVVLAVVALSQVVLMMWATGDLARRLPEEWEAAGYDQMRWALIVFLVFIAGPLLYLYTVRPKLVLVEVEPSEAS